MIKRLILTIAAILSSASIFAQNDWGGVKGTVVNRAGRAPVAEAELVISQQGKTVATAVSAVDGKFLVDDLPNGMYDMTVKAPGFLDAHVNLTIEGYVKDLIFVGMTVEQIVMDVDDSNFAEFDMDDSGFEDAPSILYGTNDPFAEIVSFGFSNKIGRAHV